MSELRKVELAGAPAAMGEAFGEQFRDEVAALTRRRMDHLAEYVGARGPGAEISRERMLRLAGAAVEAHRRFSPPIWAEFEGIARGAHLTVEELLIGNGLTDLRDYVLVSEAASSGAPPADEGGCSAFLVPPARADRGPIVGQTWDMHADARDFVVAVRRRPAGAPETVGVTTAGCLCLIGMNSAGVAVGNTNLVPTDARVGVNYLFTITRALQCTSAEEAAACIEAAPRMSGHNFYVADERTAINIETTATRSVRTAVTGEVLVHTNHYLSDRLKPLELPGRDLRDSTWRRDRLAANFAGLRGPITAADGWRQLADNTRGDGAVCNEDYEGLHGRAATLATVVQCPANRTLHACAGGARLGTREVLRIG